MCENQLWSVFRRNRRQYNLLQTDCQNILFHVWYWRHVLSTVTIIFAVLLPGILRGVERPGSVYSIIPEWWHLKILQYVAASFHLPSISTANIKTAQYTTQYKQCEIPTIPAVVIFKVLLPQFSIMAVFGHSNSCQISKSSPGLPT